MKKYKTTDEAVKAIAKVLVKEYKESEEKGCISIVGRFTDVTRGDVTSTMFDHDRKTEVSFGNLNDSEFGDITCKIADAVCDKFKVKKSEILYRDVREESVWHGSWYGGYSSTYKITKRILIIRPCREFFAINKKLKSLGLSEINFKDWYYCEVGGKRSSIFSRDYHYYAENAKKCQKVLDYLKGKKKVSYDYTSVDDLGDREYGERFETEWYGSESRQIRFTDAKGKTCTIY